MKASCHFALRNTEEAIAAGRRAPTHDEEDLIARRVLIQALLRQWFESGSAQARRSLQDVVTLSRWFLKRDPENATIRGCLRTAEEELQGICQVTGVQGAFGNLRAAGAVGRQGVSLSRDGLRTYCCSNGRLSMSSRERRRDDLGYPVPFSNPVLLVELDLPGPEGFPAVSPEERTIYFTRWGKGIWVARREAGEDASGNQVPFGEPEPLWEIDMQGHESEPSISAGGLSLYFGFNPQGRPRFERDIWVARRERTEDDDGNRAPFGTPEAVAPLGQVVELTPVISPDNLTLFFSAYHAIRGCEVYMARRDSAADDFGEPLRIESPVNTPTHSEMPFAISAEWPACGTQLVFWRSDNVIPNIQHIGVYIATWYPEGDCNANGINDCEEILHGGAADDDGDGVPDECGRINPFRRGDADADGNTDLADVVFVLHHLVAGGPAPTCMQTADANDDNAVDIADPVFHLNHLFGGGPAPSAPGGRVRRGPHTDRKR